MYLSPRMAVLAALGFASGLPAKLLGDTLDLWLADHDFSMKTIGQFGLIGLPLALNFVWAPLMDRYVPPLLGRRRGWLLLWQVMLVLGLIAMAMVGPHHADVDLTRFAIVAIFVAFFSASQDVVSDAYRTDVLDNHELGAGAAVFVNGYRIAMLASGGGALLIASRFGWPAAYLAMAGLMSVGILATLLAAEPPHMRAAPTTLRQAMIEPIHAFFATRGWIGLAVLLFIVLFKLPDQMAAKAIGPLLNQRIGFSLEQIAVVREWSGLAFVIVGAMVGGLITARLSLIVALWIFGLAQAASNLGFYGLIFAGRSMPAFVAVIGLESFCAGLVTAGFVAFLMSQCDRRYSATQYALFTSLMYGAGRLISPVTGYCVEWFGYQTLFVVSVAAALPGFLMLMVLHQWRLRPSR